MIDYFISYNQDELQQSSVTVHHAIAERGAGGNQPNNDKHDGKIVDISRGNTTRVSFDLEKKPGNLRRHISFWRELQIH